MNNQNYYSAYLHLDKLLAAQHPASFENNNIPAHDEMLFIIVHQASELWFRQILFEIEYVLKVFNKQIINDNSEELNLVSHRLNRVLKIFNLLAGQIELLNTMTPLDFLEFRNLLIPASGFQSLQFRLVEAKLGLTMQKRHQADYYKRTNEGGFNTSDLKNINDTEKDKNLDELINNWLERMPFFDKRFWNNTLFDEEINHPFWKDYRTLYSNSLTQREANKIKDFDYVFFNINTQFSEEEKSNLRSNFTPLALRAALFIMLYRDFPVFQTSYKILDTLIEIDHAISNWRHKHLSMVRRMIGMRVGTGNTSGAGYLEGALSMHYVYKDIAGLSTYLIERRNLPQLPEALVKHLSFYSW